MAFEDTLQQIVEAVPHSLHASLWDADGLFIVGYTPKDHLQRAAEFEVLCNHYPSLIELLKSDVHAPNSPCPSHLSLQWPKHSIVLQPITSHCFLSLWLAPEAFIGQAHFVIGQYQGLLRQVIG